VSLASKPLVRGLQFYLKIKLAPGKTKRNLNVKKLEPRKYIGVLPPKKQGVPLNQAMAFL
jgi:hypothetical protein